MCIIHHEIAVWQDPRFMYEFHEISDVYPFLQKCLTLKPHFQTPDSPLVGENGESNSRGFWEFFRKYSQVH